MAVANQCLLLIDDDETERQAIAGYLESLGFLVLEAITGKQGLAMMQEHQPDVVLCGLNTPSIDGAGLLQLIKQESEGTPVIVISGMGVISDVVEALRLGAADYLVKPVVDMAVLELAVNRCLEQGRLRKENLDYRLQLERVNQGLEQSLKVLEQDQLAGRQVQLKMLPATPQAFGDYHFSHKIIPSLLLSGDFVDYFTVGTEQVVFLIADVSGHGASSAFVTVLLKNMFARKRSDFTHRDDNTILSPVGMLDVANRNLMNTEIGKHATLCVGVIDLSEGSLCYSVAGHLPLPLLAVDGGCEYLAGEGMPVGLFESARYTEKTIKLPDSFVLTLFSDGILEVLPAEGVLKQEVQLKECLQGAPDTMDQVVSALDLGQVKDAPDDIAVLLISRGV